MTVRARRDRRRELWSRRRGGPGPLECRGRERRDRSGLGQGRVAGGVCVAGRAPQRIKCWGRSVGPAQEGHAEEVRAGWGRGATERAYGAGLKEMKQCNACAKLCFDLLSTQWLHYKLYRFRLFAGSCWLLDSIRA